MGRTSSFSHPTSNLQRQIYFCPKNEVDMSSTLVPGPTDKSEFVDAIEHKSASFGTG